MIRKKTCVYCGNNQIPHLTHWYFESINVLFEPLRNFLLENFVSACISRFFEKIHLDIRLVFFLQRIGVVSFQSDNKLCKIERAKVLWEEATARGIDMKEVLVFGKGFDTYIAKLQNGTYVVFSGIPRPKHITGGGLGMMDDKFLLKKKLQKHSIPVPQGASVWNLYSAIKVFKSLQKPVIVKPRSGSRGRHSITHITTLEDFIRAYKIAKQLCFFVIVEEHLEGPVYRGTVINYVLEGVLKGESPYVVGDGTSSIEYLIQEKNKVVQEGVSSIEITNSLVEYIQRQGFTLESVLPKGLVVTLTEKIGVGYGGSSSEDYEICHEDNKKLFEHAARVVGDPIIGFDFIIPNIAISYKNQKCGFLEANSLPFINLHHHPLLGKPRNIAAAVWNLILA